MKKSKKQIDDELDEFYNGSSVAFLEVCYTDKMVYVGFPFKDVTGFVRKLKGGKKKRIFLQILD